MRDQDIALRYLTGELTGGYRPDAVGKKFTPDGAPLSCPGCTTVCHVAPGSDAFAALVEAQQRLKAGPLAGAFTYLPADSLHMTIFEGVIDSSRTPERWPRHLPTEAPIAQVAEDAAARLQGRDLEMTFAARPVEVFAGFTVGMTGATKAEETHLRQTRDTLRDALNIHRPDHDSYQFHITLAYLLRWLDRDEARQVIDLSADVAKVMCGKVPEISLGPIELCRFETMHRFEPIKRL